MKFIITILPYITWILTAVCWWKIFTKANTAGWKALIPFYCDYTRFKIAGQKSWYWGYLLITIGRSISSVMTIIYLIGDVITWIQDGTFQGTAIETKTLGWGFMLILMVFDICIGRCLAKKFGKTGAFGIGLGLIPIVFVPILAFGKAEFQEKEYI